MIALIAAFFAAALLASASALTMWPKQEAAQRADVIFVLDVTGSMGGEIEDAKHNILTIGSQLQFKRPTPDIRFGAVFYRDVGDREPVKAVPLTRDLDAIRQAVDQQFADGGGDTPEHVGLGLHTALDMDWTLEAGAIRLIYLVGDAPAHHDYTDGQDVPSAVARAKEMGIKIHAVACQSRRDSDSPVAREFSGIVAPTGGEMSVNCPSPRHARHDVSLGLPLALPTHVCHPPSGISYCAHLAHGCSLVANLHRSSKGGSGT